MLIALYCQELNIIRRIFCPGEKGDRPLTKEELEKMDKVELYDWEHIENDKDIVKILRRFGLLKVW